MRKYFLYELKKNAFATGCIAFICTIIYCATLAANSRLFRPGNGASTYVFMVSTLGGLVALCVPFWTFAYKFKKRSTDLYYSLPLTHTQILTVKFLVGLVAVFAAYTLAYWVGAVFAILKIRASQIPEGFDASHIRFVFYLPQYFLTLVPIYIIYAMTAFAYTRANRVIDGLMFVLCWTFALSLAMWVLQETFDININPYYYLPFAPLDRTTSWAQSKLIGNTTPGNIYDETFGAAPVNEIIGFTLTGLMGAGATVGMFMTEKCAKAENIGQTSESWFGYRVMIPLYAMYGFALSVKLRSSIIVLLAALVLVGTYLISALYKHSLKIGKKQLIMVGCALLVGTVIGLLM